MIARKLFTALAWVSFGIIGSFSIAFVLLIIAEVL